MKTWTETLALAALASVLTLAACGPGDVGSITPDIDEEAVATVQAEVEGWRLASSKSVNPRSGLPQPPGEYRRVDPDLDEESIRRFAAHGEDERTLRFLAAMAQRKGVAPPEPFRVRLNDAETDLLLDRMRAKKAARKEAAK